MWLWAIVVIIGILSMVCDRHCCQDVKWFGRQVQVIQARWNYWELPFKSIWHCGLVCVVINSRYKVQGMRLRKLMASQPCHHVRVVFCLWAVQMTRVMRKVPHFGAGIAWGAISSGLPVFWRIVPGCSRNSYVKSPNLWVQKKLVKLWQCTQDMWLCSAKFFREFFITLPSISSETWEM